MHWETKKIHVTRFIVVSATSKVAPNLNAATQHLLKNR